MFCKLCCHLWLHCAASSLLLLQAASQGTLFRDEDNLVCAPVFPFPSPCTHEALQVGTSLNTGNFQSHNFILAFAAYSATSLLETKALFIQFENMYSLSLTSIPTLFWITASFFSFYYLLIHLMKDPFALISSTRVNWICIWIVLSLELHTFQPLTVVFAHQCFPSFLT